MSTSPPLLRNERLFRYRICLHLAEQVLVLLYRQSSLAEFLGIHHGCQRCDNN